MTQAIMLQGTASDVGKSVLVAGLCRIFYQDGRRTAPFKSQNMALNSGITADGKEMGRAQIFQAEAAGIEPDVRMNPVLLKPTSDLKAQVVPMGKVATDMDAVSYHEYKPRLREQILSVYRSLAQEYDVLVLEGAGSPAEINLRDRDIVNMGMAEMAQCPVILVADIDRGGVFAAIYGTLALLEEQERARVKGVIINKFRGDIALLYSGIEQIEALTGVPVPQTSPISTRWRRSRMSACATCGTRRSWRRPIWLSCPAVKIRWAICSGCTTVGWRRASCRRISRGFRCWGSAAAIKCWARQLSMRWNPASGRSPASVCSIP